MNKTVTKCEVNGNIGIGNLCKDYDISTDCCNRSPDADCQYKVVQEVEEVQEVQEEAVPAPTRIIMEYELGKGPIFSPPSAQILHIAMVGNKPIIWMLEDPEEASIERNFYIRIAYTEISPNMEYVGTFFEFGVPWHVFEVLNETE